MHKAVIPETKSGDNKFILKLGSGNLNGFSSILHLSTAVWYVKANRGKKYAELNILKMH